MSIVIGIDGGATKTLGRLVRVEAGGAGPDSPRDADRSARLERLAEESVGASNPHSNPEEVVKERLQKLVKSLCANSGTPQDQVSVICMGMAGCDRPYERDLLQKMVGPVAPKADIVVVNDAMTALVGGLGALEGIMVISGTGSIALGARGPEKVVRAGGWGHILDDTGSGYMVGLEAMRRICRAHDKRQPDTALEKAILDHLNLSHPPDLIGWVTQNQGDKAKIASLSRFVFECAENGDEAAAKIAEKQADELVLAADTVRRRLFVDVEEVEILGGGGNLVNSKYYRGIFARKLREASPAFKLVDARGDAVDGAVLLAASSAHPSGSFH